MDKLGLVRSIDLALHLPMRYEDETRITPIATLRDGQHAQVEGVVSACEVQVRSRRQLVVRLRDHTRDHIRDHTRDDAGGDTGGDDLVLRFLNFYP